MANAIEESQCVIIGMTENYKQSTFCRAEAEYAFQLDKKIIPLILQVLFSFYNKSIKKNAFFLN